MDTLNNREGHTLKVKSEKASTAFMASAVAAMLLLSSSLVSTSVQAGKHKHKHQGPSVTLEETLQGVSIDTAPGEVILTGFGDVFGQHMTSNKKWLVIGAPRESIDLDGSGAIENFSASRGTPTNANGDNESQQGSVYIYKRTKHGPVFHQKLTSLLTIPKDNEGNPIGSAGDRFGSGVVLFNGQLFISVANDRDIEGTDPLEDDFFFSGKVYVYSLDKRTKMWKKVQELTSDVPISNGAFGSRTDANHVVGIPKYKLLAIGEQGNSSEVAGKLHIFKKRHGKWVPAHPPIKSPRFDEFGGNANMANSLILAGDRHLVVDEHIGNDAYDALSQRLLVYKVGKRGIVGSGPVQIVSPTVTPLNVPEDQEQAILAGFGAPPFLSFFFDDNISLCGNIFEYNAQAGLAAAGNIVAVAEPCATLSDDWRTMHGAVKVYTVDNRSDTPLKLKQTLQGPSSSVFYGNQYFGGSQSVHTDGKRIVVGGAVEPDIFGAYELDGFFNPPEPIDFPAVGERVVDVYNLDGCQFKLEASIETPEPTTDPIYGDLYGNAVHLLHNSDDVLINRVGWTEFTGSKVYRYELDDDSRSNSCDTSDDSSS